MGIFYFSAVSCCQFNTLHVWHKKMSPVRAKEHKEWKTEGGRQKKPEMRIFHVLWNKDNGIESWLSNPHQNSCSTRPWNRICVLWMLKNPQKMCNDWIMKAGWKKKSSKRPPKCTDNINPNKQTRKKHFSYNDMYSNKPKHEEKLANPN